VSKAGTLARAALRGVVEPTARWLLRRGVSPDAVTVVGTVGAVAGAVVLVPTGHLFAGTLVVWFFVVMDMLDGAMARQRGISSPLGGVLDSVCDRISDGALFAAISWWAGANDRPLLSALALFCLVAGQVVSYVKARAEAAGLRADGGLLERTERLVIGLVGLGLTGLGVPYALDVALWLLAVGSLVTVAQRLVAVTRSARAHAAGPASEDDDHP
jgi:CDP-diacylglycerol---glycerol-3-phosphate 3-phosphatidyltransferase